LRYSALDTKGLRIAEITLSGREPVAKAVLTLASPRGFSASALAVEVRSRGQADYGPRRATYDLKKFRAKQLVRKIEHTWRYEASRNGLRGAWPPC